MRFWQIGRDTIKYGFLEYFNPYDYDYIAPNAIYVRT